MIQKIKFVLLVTALFPVSAYSMEKEEQTHPLNFIAKDVLKEQYKPTNEYESYKINFFHQFTPQTVEEQQAIEQIQPKLKNVQALWSTELSYRCCGNSKKMNFQKSFKALPRWERKLREKFCCALQALEHRELIPHFSLSIDKAQLDQDKNLWSLPELQQLLTRYKLTVNYRINSEAARDGLSLAERNISEFHKNKVFTINLPLLLPTEHATIKVQLKKGIFSTIAKNKMNEAMHQVFTHLKFPLSCNIFKIPLYFYAKSSGYSTRKYFVSLRELEGKLKEFLEDDIADDELQLNIRHYQAHEIDMKEIPQMHLINPQDDDFFQFIVDGYTRPDSFFNILEKEEGEDELFPVPFDPSQLPSSLARLDEEDLESAIILSLQKSDS